MARDDQRMHGGDTPGLVPGRGHETHEEPVGSDGQEPGADAPELTGEAALPDQAGSSTTDRQQGSAPGGDVATRSGTIATPDDEQA